MTSPHPDPLRWKALTVVCAAFFMTVLDVSIVNVPVGAIALSLTPPFVRESHAARESTPDVLGAVTVTAGLALLVYAVSTAPTHHWGSARTIVLLVLSAALLGAFLVVEARAKD